MRVRSASKRYGKESHICASEENSGTSDASLIGLANFVRPQILSVHFDSTLTQLAFAKCPNTISKRLQKAFSSANALRVFEIQMGDWVTWTQ